MLLDEIRSIKSEKRDLKNFGITIGIALGILTSFLWWKGKDTYTVIGIISLVFIILGLIMPAVLKPLQRAWMAFAVILGWVMTRLILSVLFFVVFTSIGFLAKLFGKKFLDLEYNNASESYWIKREPRPFNSKDYERQF